MHASGLHVCLPLGFVLIAALGRGAAGSPGLVWFFTNDAAFFEAAANAGKVQKFSWSFKPDTLPPNAVVALDDPLDITTHGLNKSDPWGKLWPPEVDNVQFSSNTNPPGPLVPRGSIGLAYAKSGAVPDLTANALLANLDVASFDVISGPPAGGSHTALAVEMVSVDLDGQPNPALFHVTVYDTLGADVGSLEFSATQGENLFLGILMAGAIGRIDVWDMLGGFEGISSIIAYGGTGCSGAGGDCCTAHSTAGCADFDCCELVCASDPFCCNFEWDQLCAEQAAACTPACAPAPCPGASDESCCVAHASPGCEDLDCCQAVCALDLLCCLTAWDQLCADLAERTCAPPGPAQNEQVIADLNAAIALANQSIAQLDVSIAATDDGLKHTQDALAQVNAAAAFYAQAAQLSQQCGPCAAPAAPHFSRISEKINEANQQGLDAELQLVVAGFQQGFAGGHSAAAVAQISNALGQMLSNPPDGARAKEKIKRAAEKQKLAANLEKLVKDELERFDEKDKRASEKLTLAYLQGQQLTVILQQCGPCAGPALNALASAQQQLALAIASVGTAIQSVNGSCEDPSGACGALRESITFGQAVIDLLVESSGLLSGCQAQACPWDCADGDHIVGVVDFLAVLAEWGLVGTPCDVDGAGVGVTDFLGVLAHWGPCTVCPLPPPPADICAPLQETHCADDFPFDELCVPLILANGRDGAPHAVLCHCVNTLGSGLCWVNVVAPRVISCSGTCAPPLVCRMQIVTPDGRVIIEQSSQHFTNGDAAGTEYSCFCAP